MQTDIFCKSVGPISGGDGFGRLCYLRGDMWRGQIRDRVLPLLTAFGGNRRDIMVDFQIFRCYCGISNQQEAAPCNCGSSFDTKLPQTDRVCLLWRHIVSDRAKQTKPCFVSTECRSSTPGCTTRRRTSKICRSWQSGISSTGRKRHSWCGRTRRRSTLTRCPGDCMATCLIQNP